VAAAIAAVLMPALAAAQAAQASSPRDVTFTKDVAPILQRSCQRCHRPDSMAPMSLLTYEDTRPWAKAIKQKLMAREMPPWYIDRTVGIQKFKDAPSLTDEEIAAIVKWVDSGAPKGNPADMPPPRQFEDADKWHIGKPDLIVRSRPHRIPPVGPDWFGDYIVDTELTEDRYIRAVEVKPTATAKAAVHHETTYIIQDESDSPLLGRNLDPIGETENGAFLNEYAIGKNGDIYPEGSGRLMKAGAKVRFNMHYHSIGEEKLDQTELAFIFYPRGYVPKYQFVARHTGDNFDLDIPPGADSVRFDGYTRLPQNARMTQFQPHMHNRGKAMCMEAIYPDGKVEQLNCVSNYKFAWHITYPYADDAMPLLPAGTVIHIISWYDNSAANKGNPDPRAWVGRGSRTIDEMSFAWIGYVWLTDEDYKQQVEERKAKQTITSPQ
jgi:hypothetical protein